MTEYWMTIGAAVVVSATVSAFVALWSGARTIHFNAVIDERKKWRDDLRRLVPELLSETKPDSRRHVRDAIFLRLNPFRDTDTMRIVDEYLAEQTEDRRERVVRHFQQYLKFEWTRAKFEASWFPCLADVRAGRRIERQERHE